MGGSNSTRRVSFESDEDDNVTVVKGVRLSENVINRMREPSKPPSRSSPLSQAPSKPTVSPPSAPAADLGTPLNDPPTTPADPAALVAPSFPSLPSPALEEPVTLPTTDEERILLPSRLRD
ncbi:coiled-coil-helix-coiled-coil-helix domain containing 3a isoform X1 [Tachysurus ichikawai]